MSKGPEARKQGPCGSGEGQRAGSVKGEEDLRGKAGGGQAEMMWAREGSSSTGPASAKRGRPEGRDEGLGLQM